MRTTYLLATLTFILAACGSKKQDARTELIVVNSNNGLEITQARDSVDGAKKRYFIFATIKNNNADTVRVQLEANFYDEDNKQVGGSKSTRGFGLAPGDTLVFNNDHAIPAEHFFPYKVTLTAKDQKAELLALHQ